MEWWFTLAIMLASLLAFLAIGLPVAFAFITVNIVGIYFLMGGLAGLSLLTGSAFAALANFALIPIPLFILLGELLLRSGLATEAIESTDRWIGRMPGRLAVTAVGGGTLFGALSGSSMASVAMLGTTLIPEMKRRGYDARMTVGPILASGGLAVLIPPSALGVLLGSLANVSIAQILIAGVVPGLILALTYVCYFVARAWLQPDMAPPHPTSHFDLNAKLLALAKLLPLVALMVVVTGFIFLGIATPSESAALGAIACALILAIRRKLTARVITEAALSTASTTGMILLIIVGSVAYSQLLAATGATAGLVDFVAQLGLPPIATIIVMQVIVLFLGCFIDAISIMLITIPVFMPIVALLGLDPIWFSILILIQLELSGITPPFGVLLFVLKGVRPELTTSEIYRSVLPIVGLQLIVVAILLFFPATVTWLPSLMKP